MKRGLAIALILTSAVVFSSRIGRAEEQVETRSYSFPKIVLVDEAAGNPEKKKLHPITRIRNLFAEKGVEIKEEDVVEFDFRNEVLSVTADVKRLEQLEEELPHFHELAARQQLHIILEFIEVEASLYHDWMFENRITGDGRPLREKAQAWVKADQASVIETVVLTARSGQRAKSESISEVIYPTEPGVPEIPTKISLEGPNTKAPELPATSSAFETRNAGSTLEVDPVLGPDQKTVDVNLSPEMVRLNGVIDWPPENELPFFTVSMPRFYTMKITTQVTLRHNGYAFLGTTTPLRASVEGRRPIVLMFVRADVAVPTSFSLQPSDSENE